MPELPDDRLTVTVPLSAGEMRVLREIALGRHGPKRGCGVTNTLKCRRYNDMDADLLGVIGEYAVAKQFGGEWNRTPDLKTRRPDVWWGGFCAEVKARPRREMPFTVWGTKGFRANVGILVWAPNLHEPEIVGWIEQRIFREHARPVDYGYGPCLEVSYGETQPIGLFPWALEEARRDEIEARGAGI